MRRIEIDDVVWDAIAEQGKFGETENDVLRRILRLPPRDMAQARPALGPRSDHELRTSSPDNASRSRVATKRMSSFVQNGTLVIEFADGPRKTFALPDRDNKKGIRQSRDEAVQFARAAGASYGQEMAVKKALTEAGYHLMK